MVRIYGSSDDLVEIEGDLEYPEDEIGCYNQAVRIWFKDGTVALIGYPKEGMGVWWIKIEKQGSANQRLTICEDEDADIYSDILEIDAEVEKHEVTEVAI